MDTEANARTNVFDLFRLDGKTAVVSGGGLIEQFEDRMLEGIPMRRFGGPEDLKGVIVFLASPAAAYVTDQTVVVDGGQTAW